MDSAHPIARHLRPCVAALVVALVVVPPLVSALDGGSGPTCPSIRLNRVCPAPVARIKFKPLPYDLTVQSVAFAEEQKLSRIIARTTALDDSSLESRPFRSPETRRGPPNALLA